MSLEIKIYPHPVLRQHCQSIVEIDQSIIQLAEEMLATMYQHQGVGLATPQVGRNIRLIVIDVGQGPLLLVNPRIIDRSGKSSMIEGCLSLPKIQIKVRRAEKVKVEAINLRRHRRLVQIEATGLLAHTLQHEIDHLNGRLIIDYLPWWRRFLVENKLRKIANKK